MGRPPKPPGEAVTRHARKQDAGILRWDGVTRGPELPDDYDWCPRTEQWWQTWRNSPQAMLMVSTDWEEMLMTAFLHNQLWGKSMRVDKTGVFAEVGPTPAEAKALAGEVRIRLEKLGATVRDRGSMGMYLGTGEADVVKQAEEVVKAVDYRKMLDEPDS